MFYQRRCYWPVFYSSTLRWSAPDMHRPAHVSTIIADATAQNQQLGITNYCDDFSILGDIHTGLQSSDNFNFEEIWRFVIVEFVFSHKYWYVYYSDYLSNITIYYIFIYIMYRSRYIQYYTHSQISKYVHVGEKYLTVFDKSLGSSVRM